MDGFGIEAVLLAFVVGFICGSAVEIYLHRRRGGDG